MNKVVIYIQPGEQTHGGVPSVTVPKSHLIPDQRRESFD